MMNFIIEPVTNSQTFAAADFVRRQVFEVEWGINVPDFAGRAPGDVMILVARTADSLEPAATLAVVNTTSDRRLHSQYGLDFDTDAKVARYTQLAVLAPYRKMLLPLRLILEGRRRFVKPGGFHHTWMLCDAKRARSSSFARLCGFRAQPYIFRTEYGFSRVLLRDEVPARSTVVSEDSADRDRALCAVACGAD